MFKMEGYSLFYITICLLAVSAHDEFVEMDSSEQKNGSFYIPPDAFSPKRESTTPSEVNTTNPFQNVSTAANEESSEADESFETSEQEDSSQFAVNTSTFTSISANTETSSLSHFGNNTEDLEEIEIVDLTVTDSTGCYTAKRDKIEENCFHKFENVVVEITLKDEREGEKRKDICCALENYEKCALNGYLRSNCGADHDELKTALKSAAIFMGAMTNISCASHRGMCGSANSAAGYSAGLLVSCVVLVLLL